MMQPSPPVRNMLRASMPPLAKGCTGLRATGQRPVMQVLRDKNHQGWIAVEPFNYPPDGPACAAYSAGYLRATWDSLA